MVARIYNPNTEEEDTGGSLGLAISQSGSIGNSLRDPVSIKQGRQNLRTTPSTSGLLTHLHTCAAPNTISQILIFSFIYFVNVEGSNMPQHA